MADPQSLFQTLLETNITKTIHRDTYPAISTARPELVQAGRTVLITGGGTGVGLSIARSFVRASADMIIIIGRRSDVLKTASSNLEQEAKAAGTSTKIITRTCDVANLAEVEALWQDLALEDITVDVYIANAARFTEPKSILELGADEVWSQVEINARSPLYFAEKFYSQKSGKQKFIINVTTQAVAMTAHPEIAQRPAYTFSKMTATILFQVIAQSIPAEKMQVINFHPGVVYNDAWKAMGFPPEYFDHNELCGDFAVWATTKEAQFLHGRYVWAAWDVEELSKGEIRKRLDEDFYFLRASVVGLRGGLYA
ncbi:hypothetical protein OIDMADRAFT_108095 [Oidiodendron maius Zn]|uniref:NAD(P)-binding protein n=1 Tax=Oidiodendron maius (strain Zn) TaxID=913774 RepID=A0A0C3HX66_OIDMZ|nr:hypothetical protein OIDMADRAFT_108095 [Oidiodendron maius Zn]